MKKLDKYLASERWEIPKRELYEMVACASTRMHDLLNSGEDLEQAMLLQDFIRAAMKFDVKDLYGALEEEKKAEEEKNAEEEPSPEFPPETPIDSLDAAVDSATEAYMQSDGNASASGHAGCS